jgi:hypothetical protein
MFARQLRYAGLALAALALATSLNLAPAAQAASGPDLEAQITPSDIHRDQPDGGVEVYADIKNVGDAKSAPTVMYKQCAYLPVDKTSILLDWYSVDIMHPSVPALNPNQGSPNTYFLCHAENGRAPVAVRLTVAASQGETNLANNKTTVWVFKLDKNS